MVLYVRRKGGVGESMGVRLLDEMKGMDNLIVNIEERVINIAINF